jgi:hypothetical protein
MVRSTAPATPDVEKLNAFLGEFVGDLGAAVHAAMVVIGEKLEALRASSSSSLV